MNNETLVDRNRVLGHKPLHTLQEDKFKRHKNNSVLQHGNQQ